VERAHTLTGTVSIAGECRRVSGKLSAAESKSITIELEQNKIGQDRGPTCVTRKIDRHGGPTTVPVLRRSFAATSRSD